MTKEAIISKCFFELFISGLLEGVLGVLLFYGINSIMVNTTISNHAIGLMSFGVLVLTVFSIIGSWYYIIDKRDKRLNKYGFTL